MGLAVVGAVGILDGEEGSEAGMDDDGAVAPARVLLVDDEPGVRSLLRRLLSRTGRFEVVGEAADGGEAVHAASRLQPDITVLDLMMPVSGEAALPHLLKVAPACMVVVLSALDPADHRDRLLAAGAFCCYSKAQTIELPELLIQDLDRFQTVLRGEETIVGWATH